MTPIRVVIADDHPILRSGLRQLIDSQADLEVIGEASTRAEAVLQARQLQPDVLTLDLTMPDGNGLEIIGHLYHACDHLRVLVLTMHNDPAYLRAALAAGAAGYVVKTAADTELLSAIRAVAQGRVFVDLNLSQEGVRAALGTGSKALSFDHKEPTLLSARERQVLERIAIGHSNQEIADQLFLSVKTIETYRARVMTKTGARGRADLVRYAIETQMIAAEKLPLKPFT